MPGFKMNDQNKRPDGAQDAYDLLSRNFSSFGAPTQETPEDDVKNSGEIYFSANGDTNGHRPTGASNRRSDIVLPEEDVYDKIMNSHSSRSGTARPFGSSHNGASRVSSGRTAQQSGRTSSSVGKKQNAVKNTVAASSSAGGAKIGSKKKKKRKINALQKKIICYNNSCLKCGAPSEAGDFKWSRSLGVMRECWNR